MLEDASAPKDSRNGKPPRDGYRYKVLVKNAGAKTVKLIDWDYVFLDANTRQEVARRQFTSEEKVRPGKEGVEVHPFAAFLTVNAGASRTGRRPSSSSDPGARRVPDGTSAAPLSRVTARGRVELKGRFKVESPFSL